MKWVARLMSSVAAMLLAAGGASASTGAPSTPADVAWAAAAKSDSLEGYAAFAMTYPDSEHAGSAYDRLSGAAAISGGGAAPLPAGTPSSDDRQMDQGPLNGKFMIIGY
jgi:hypothetical protein